MKITINGTTYTPKHDAEIVQALWNVSHLEGVIPGVTPEDDLAIRGKAVDYYLLAATLAIRLAAGDIELVEKADKAQKKDYQQKLMRVIRTI